jgi:hypothetical protein
VRVASYTVEINLGGSDRRVLRDVPGPTEVDARKRVRRLQDSGVYPPGRLTLSEESEHVRRDRDRERAEPHKASVV